MDREKRLDTLREMVMLNIEKAYQRQAVYYNRGRKDVRFQVEEMVMRKRIFHPTPATRSPPSWHQIGKGPTKLSRPSP